MRALVLAFAVLVVGVAAAQADDSCAARATARKLAGAAQNSFMKKCRTDAAASCDAASVSRKLAGAARTSFTRKCVTDAVGT